jgi:predicted RNase H-like nuclease (RuvC/YqgF family)
VRVYVIALADCRCSELQARLTVSRDLDGEHAESEETTKLKQMLRAAEEEIAELHARAEMKDAKVIALEQKFDTTVVMLREQLGHQANRIRQLSRELHERTASVTQLSTQVGPSRGRPSVKSVVVSAAQCTSEGGDGAGDATSASIL